MNTNNAGGGEVLQYIGNNQTQNQYQYLDVDVIRQFMYLPWVKLLIVILLGIIAFLFIARIFEMKSPLKGRAITNELEHMDRVKQRDNTILKANSMMSSLTKIVEASPFSISKSYIEYWNYNLERANIRIPGGYRTMKAQEFNAIIKSVQAFVIFLSIIIIVVFSAPIGMMAIIITILVGSTMPMATVRQKVKTKDAEVVENFADMYLMIHYVLLASAGTPISSILKSFDKTTSSEEMHRFVDVCIHYIDTYGEYEATRYITRQYREIPQVGKLMRLIRQANEGGDVRAELIGFRNELIEAKKYSIEQHMNRIVMQARASFNILVPVLIQAIISAMAIYFKDLSVTSTFL